MKMRIGFALAATAVVAGVLGARAERNAPWTAARAWAWYDAQPWIRGCNYMPASCANRIDQWQELGSEERFAEMEREAALMSSIGLNAVRVILGDQGLSVWCAEHDGMMARFERMLGILDRHGIRTIVVLGNDCSRPKELWKMEQPGPQTCDIGYHGGRKLSQHGSFPNAAGYTAADDPVYGPRFFAMCEEFLVKYAHDRRILFWNLWNEPGNNNRCDISVPHIRRIFELAWRIDPDQPLTADVWSWDMGTDPASKNRAQYLSGQLSDIISYHSYANYESQISIIRRLKRHFARPLVNTEWLARINHCTVQECYPLFYAEKVGCTMWGFVAGKYQTYEPWESMWKEIEKGGGRDYDMTKWFHDLYRPSHRPYDPEEIRLIRKFNDLADRDFASPGRIAIVIDRKAPDATHFAAEELRKYLGLRFGGADVPIVNEPKDDVFSIVLGTNAWSVAAGLRPEKLARDGFAVKTVGRRLYIAGCDTPGFGLRGQLKAGFRGSGECATAYGVYDFLEKYADCRFYFPGELGEIVPRGDDLAVGGLDYTSEPDFSARRVYDGPMSKYFNDDKGAIAKNLMRLRMETLTIPCCHGTRANGYLERFSKTHPEYFALAGGIRHIDPGEQHACQLCWSSGVMEEVYQDAKSYLKGEGPEVRGIPSLGGKGFAWNHNCVGRKYVDVMPQDSLIPCQCDACREAWAKGPKESPATELVWSRVAEWGRRLKEEGVPGDLTMMSYHPYMTVPKVDLPDNVQVMVAVTGPFGIGNAGKMRADDARIRAWAEKLGHKVWLWTYPDKYGTLALPGIPNFSMHAWGEFYRQRKDMIFGGFAECETDRWFYNHLNQYVFGRVMWDNAADPDALIREYLERMFGGGEVSRRMGAVVDGLERKWMEEVVGNYVDTPVGPKCIVPDDEALWTKVYSPEYIASVAADLAAAKAAVPQAAADRDLVLARIDLYDREIYRPLKEASDGYLSRQKAIAAQKAYRPGEEIALVPFTSNMGGVIGGKPKLGTESDIRCTVRMWKTDKDLCVKFDCAEPRMDDICAITRPRDHKFLWQDNNVEFFFSPDGSRRKGYHVIVNSEGSIADMPWVAEGQAATELKPWNPEIRTDIRKEQGRWTCEIAVPLSSIGPIAPSMPVNFCRSRILKTPGTYHQLFISSPLARKFWDSDGYAVIEL